MNEAERLVPKLKLSPDHEMHCFKGLLAAELGECAESNFISNNDEDLFYRVPNRILSFIDGCPSKVTNVEISYNDDYERLVIVASEVESEKERFTISVPIDKIFKLLESEGLKANDEITDQLFAIRNRAPLIIRAISAYLKKNVQIMEKEIDEIVPILPGMKKDTHV